MDPLAPLLDGLNEIRERQRAHEQAIHRLTEAVIKLAVIEERQAKTTEQLAQLMADVRTTDQRLDRLEQAEQLNRQLRYWVFGLITLVGSVVVYTMLRGLGLS